MPRSFAALLTVLGGVVAAAACAAGQPPRTGETPAANRTSMETYDDRLVRVEARASGFGGMFIDPQGLLAVYLTNPSEIGAARSAIEAVFGANWIPSAGLRAVQGQYVVSQLKRWAVQAGAVLDVPGVTLLDLDESRNRVVVGIEDASRAPVVEQALSRLPIPREAVVIEVTGPVRPVT